jgi:hypothetical protein
VLVCQPRIAVVLGDKDDDEDTTFGWNAILDAVEESTRLEQVLLACSATPPSADASTTTSSSNDSTEQSSPSYRSATNVTARKEDPQGSYSSPRRLPLLSQRQYSLDFTLCCNHFRRRFLETQRVEHRRVRANAAAPMEQQEQTLDASMRVLQDWYRATHQPDEL